MPTVNHSTRLDEVWAEARRRVAELAGDVFVWSNSTLVAQAESPIEELFLIALACEAEGYDTIIRPQYQIGPHRVDVMIGWWDGDLPERTYELATVVVELDGHDFHERTKEQAAADKSRDRYLTAQTFRVVRFTGSEVWADPFKCAKEALDIASTAFYELQRMR